MNAILGGLSLAVSLLFGVLTVAFIFNGLRRLYKGKGGGARDVLFVTLLSLLTGVLIVVQMLDVVNQITSH
jgi:hypothetical protein